MRSCDLQLLQVFLLYLHLFILASAGSSSRCMLFSPHVFQRNRSLHHLRLQLRPCSQQSHALLLLSSHFTNSSTFPAQDSPSPHDASHYFFSGHTRGKDKARNPSRSIQAACMSAIFVDGKSATDAPSLSLTPNNLSLIKNRCSSLPEAGFLVAPLQKVTRVVDQHLQDGRGQASCAGGVAELVRSS